MTNQEKSRKTTLLIITILSLVVALLVIVIILLLLFIFLYPSPETTSPLPESYKFLEIHPKNKNLSPTTGTLQMKQRSDLSSKLTYKTEDSSTFMFMWKKSDPSTAEFDCTGDCYCRHDDGRAELLVKNYYTHFIMMNWEIVRFDEHLMDVIQPAREKIMGECAGKYRIKCSKDNIRVTEMECNEARKRMHQYMTYDCIMSCRVNVDVYDLQDKPRHELSTKIEEYTHDMDNCYPIKKRGRINFLCSEDSDFECEVEAARRFAQEKDTIFHCEMAGGSVKLEVLTEDNTKFEDRNVPWCIAEQYPDFECTLIKKGN